MKIYDCFSYWDEDLLLDLRLNILNNHVDYFVITEGDKTWQNNPKKLRFDIKKFANFEKKIIYIPVTDMPAGDNPYLRENHQRNCLERGFAKADKNDIIIISDLDEIPNPKVLNKFKSDLRFAVFKQKHFYYKLNLLNINSPDWHGSRICIKKYLKSPQWLRNIKIKERNFLLKYIYRENYQIIKDGGWHFSDIKTPRELIQKISSFAHGELNQDKFKNEEIINKKIENLKDVFDRPIKYEKVIIDKDFPDYFVENKHIYQNWII